MTDRSQYFKCDHSKKVNKGGVQNCYSCGIMIPQEPSVQAYKTHKMQYGTAFNPQHLLKSLQKIRHPSINFDPNQEYFKTRNQLIEYMWDIAEKLRLSLNTTHLSIYFMDFINSKVQVPSSQLSIYAATAVMLGAKAIELDERIPFISKLKRYSGLYDHTKEFTRVEGVFVKNLHWNLQCVTLIDLLDFYLSQGVLFSNDKVSAANSNEKNIDDLALREKNINGVLQQSNGDSSPSSMDEKQLKSPISQQQLENEKSPETQILGELSQQQQYQICSKIEKEFSRLANLIIRDTSFYKYEINTLAAACVSFLRTMCGISNEWNENLTHISKLEFEQFKECYSHISSKFSEYFTPSVPSQMAQQKRVPLKHSKTTDIYEVENNLVKKTSSNIKNPNTGLYNSDKKNLLSQEMQNFEQQFYNHCNVGGVPTTNKYLQQNAQKQNFPTSSSDMISFTQFNQFQPQQLKSQNSYGSKPSNTINSTGISTINNNYSINNISAGIGSSNSSAAFRHQSLLSNYPTSSNASHFNNRLSSSNYVQKVYRVNSGLI